MPAVCKTGLMAWVAVKLSYIGSIFIVKDDNVERCGNNRLE